MGTTGTAPALAHDDEHAKHERIRLLAYWLWHELGRELNSDFGYWLWAEELVQKGSAEQQGKKLEMIQLLARAHWKINYRNSQFDSANWIKGVYAIMEMEEMCKHRVGIR